MRPPHFCAIRIYGYIGTLQRSRQFRAEGRLKTGPTSFESDDRTDDQCEKAFTWHSGRLMDITTFTRPLVVMGGLRPGKFDAQQYIAAHVG